MSMLAFTRPLWEWILVVAGGAFLLILGAITVFLFYDSFDSRRRGRRRLGARQRSELEVKKMLAFPYYVDAAGLRNVVASLGIDLPVSRQVTTGRRLSLAFHRVGGER